MLSSNVLKYYLTCYCLFVINYSYAQQTKVDVIKISKNAEKQTTQQQKELKKNVKQDTLIRLSFLAFQRLSRLSDIAKEIPSTCDSVTYLIQGVFKDVLKEAKEDENKFSVNANIILGGLKPGQKFFIESISTSCVKVKFKSYTVLITQ